MSRFVESNSILGEKTVVIIHTDQGTEFVNKAVREMLVSAASLDTNTCGYDPKAK